jgi:F0F1-type ATP synthase membrane subunit a
MIIFMIIIGLILIYMNLAHTIISFLYIFIDKYVFMMNPIYIFKKKNLVKTRNNL